MKCRQAKNLIFDHIDGMISDPDRIALERHLNGCSECESMATGLSRSLDLLHKLPIAEPSENFNWKLRLRLLKEKNAVRDGGTTERQWYRAWNMRFSVSAVSALAVVLVTGAFLMKSSIQPGSDTVPFELRPDAMPLTAATQTVSRPAQSARATAFDPDQFIGTTAVAPRPVAFGAIGGQGVPMFIEDSTRPVLDIDALKVQYLQSRMEHYRLHQLEHQVDVLQSELNKCNLANK